MKKNRTHKKSKGIRLTKTPLSERVGGYGFIHWLNIASITNEEEGYAYILKHNLSLKRVARIFDEFEATSGNILKAVKRYGEEECLVVAREFRNRVTQERVIMYIQRIASDKKMSISVLSEEEKEFIFIYYPDFVRQVKNVKGSERNRVKNILAEVLVA